jgi:diacylglycerol O-acyltransferase
VPQPERLSAEDTRILRLENDRIAGHTAKVVVLDDRLDTETLRGHMAARLDRAPALRERLVATPLGIANPVWAPDPRFDLRHHVRPSPAREPVGRAALREVVAHAMEGRLPRDRPLWSMEVVERLEGGGSAIVWLMHHAAADGASCMRIGEALLWGGELAHETGGASSPTEAAGSAPGHAPHGDGAGLSRAELLRSGLADRARGAGAATAGAARALASPGGLRDAAAQIALMPAALRRELAPLPEPSPFDGPLGPRRAVAWLRRPVDELRRIEHACGGHVTLNDVLLAAVAGGVRSWLERRGERVPPMRAKVPVSMHPVHEQPDALGNRDSFVFVDLAVAREPPLARLQAINAETARRKALHDPSTLYAFFNDLSHVAPPLARAASRLAMSPRAFTFSVSNVRGPAAPIAVAGVPVRALYSLAEIAPRHALRLSGLSLAADFAIGLTSDPAVVPGVDELARCIDGAVDELLAAAS